MLFAQVLNSLILKVKNIVILAAIISKFSLQSGYICQVSFVYVILINHVRFAVGQGKHREF